MPTLNDILAALLLSQVLGYTKQKAESFFPPCSMTEKHRDILIKYSSCVRKNLGVLSVFFAGFAEP